MKLTKHGGAIFLLVPSARVRRSGGDLQAIYTGSPDLGKICALFKQVLRFGCLGCELVDLWIGSWLAAGWFGSWLAAGLGLGGQVVWELVGRWVWN